MAINYDHVSVGTTATSIISSNTNAKVRKIENVGSNTIFVGGANTVTTTNGFPIKVGETLNISDYTGDIFGIVAASTEDASYIEEDFQ
jgi:hypothetical protein